MQPVKNNINIHWRERDLHWAIHQNWSKSEMSKWGKYQIWQNSTQFYLIFFSMLGEFHSISLEKFTHFWVRSILTKSIRSYMFPMYIKPFEEVNKKSERFWMCVYIAVIKQKLVQLKIEIIFLSPWQISFWSYQSKNYT